MEHFEKFKEITSKLRNSEYYADEEKTIFESYYEGTMTIERAYNEFRKMNQEINCGVNLFKEWIESLGFKRK